MRPSPRWRSAGSWRDLGWLAAFGFVDSGYWIFAPYLVVSLGGASGRRRPCRGWSSGSRAWPVPGPAISATTLAGATPTRWHWPPWRRLALLKASPERLAVTWISAAVFGWAFMALSGLYLVHGIRLLPGRAEWGQSCRSSPSRSAKRQAHRPLPGPSTGSATPTHSWNAPSSVCSSRPPPRFSRQPAKTAPPCRKRRQSLCPKRTPPELAGCADQPGSTDSDPLAHARRPCHCLRGGGDSTVRRGRPTVMERGFYREMAVRGMEKSGSRISLYSGSAPLTVLPST